METEKPGRLILTDRLCLDDFADSVISLRTITEEEAQARLREPDTERVFCVSSNFINAELYRQRLIDLATYRASFGRTGLPVSDHAPLTSRDSFIVVGFKSIGGQDVLIFREVAIELDERLFAAEAAESLSERVF